MHKLVILISHQDDWIRFYDEWPRFLRLAESMPGLQREAMSRVTQVLYGELPHERIYELFFCSRAAIEQALASPQGLAAGRLLQKITNGRVVLFIADHKEDDLANIRKFIPESGASE